jgi:hypothetical protein
VRPATILAGRRIAKAAPARADPNTTPAAKSDVPPRNTPSAVNEAIATPTPTTMYAFHGTSVAGRWSGRMASSTMTAGTSPMRSPSTVARSPGTTGVLNAAPAAAMRPELSTQSSMTLGSRSNTWLNMSQKPENTRQKASTRRWNRPTTETTRTVIGSVPPASKRSRKRVWARKAKAQRTAATVSTFRSNVSAFTMSRYSR